MRELLLSITVMALLAGCSSKEEEKFFRIYEKNKDYHLKLQRTEKINLKDGEFTKILLTATYLFEPVSDKEDKRDEKFIVGFFVDDEDVFVDMGDYEITLNGTEPKSVKMLKKNDPLLKSISFDSEWTHFYLLTFPHTNSKSFKLLFESDFYGKGELHFAKVAKYVLTKKAF
jgi:hypothetical protein